MDQVALQTILAQLDALKTDINNCLTAIATRVEGLALDVTTIKNKVLDNTAMYPPPDSLRRFQSNLGVPASAASTSSSQRPIPALEQLRTWERSQLNRTSLPLAWVSMSPAIGPKDNKRCCLFSVRVTCAEKEDIRTCFFERHFNWCLTHLRAVQVGFNGCFSAQTSHHPCGIIFYDPRVDWQELCEATRASSMVQQFLQDQYGVTQWSYSDGLLDNILGDFPTLSSGKGKGHAVESSNTHNSLAMGGMAQSSGQFPAVTESSQTYDDSAMGGTNVFAGQAGIAEQHGQASVSVAEQFDLGLLQGVFEGEFDLGKHTGQTDGAAGEELTAGTAGLPEESSGSDRDPS
ncbi:hypothetical protein K458DRAFT_403836 [Lentithecium fluviatile CBS 122367]|uniref:Uncharacterized protein n=1 Tax=Lentithecium fluviatile CBS 122367 TaxID=1168545 RepID=A0A6G1J304_9PLEO|nr:hypothetical protein K458DRAFT_403836 [Lentithecium fluviatile CBS 122367]